MEAWSKNCMRKKNQKSTEDVQPYGHADQF